MISPTHAYQQLIGVLKLLLSLLAGWTYKYPVLGCWEHETILPTLFNSARV